MSMAADVQLRQDVWVIGQLLVPTVLIVLHQNVDSTVGRMLSMMVRETLDEYQYH